MEDKLKKAIDRYHAADTSRKQAGAKGAITRIVNERATLIGAEAARSEVLEAVKTVDSGIAFWIKERFTPGSFYQEGNYVYGWWDDGSIQVQAEKLPLHFFSGSFYSVSFYHREEEALLWQQRGFEPAEDLPLRSIFSTTSGWSQVSFPVERSEFWAKYGYALPCDLQWRWHPGEEYFVLRTIVDAGFWRAYKWWAGCQWWYYERHPEWFSGSNLWGAEEPTYYFAPEPDSVVLGGNKKRSA